MAQTGIVISCRGTARSARVRIAKAFLEIASGISEGSKGSLAFHNNRHSDGTVAAGRLIERGSIAIAILRNTAKEILSAIERRALSTADLELIRLQIDPQ